jgi:hypothetical protein
MVLVSEGPPEQQTLTSAERSVSHVNPAGHLPARSIRLRVVCARCGHPAVEGGSAHCSNPWRNMARPRQPGPAPCIDMDQTENGWLHGGHVQDKTGQCARAAAKHACWKSQRFRRFCKRPV